MTNSHDIDIDYLKLYFREPIKITDRIILKQPSIGDIVKFGEASFYSGVYAFIANPTMYRLQLWESGVDWTKIDDYSFFMTMASNLEYEKSQYFFDGIDFTTFSPYNIFVPNADPEQPAEQRITFYSESLDLEISEEVYYIIAQYIKTMFNIFPKTEKAKGKATKEIMIEEDKINQAIKEQNGEKSTSLLLPLISGCVNHAGFKYSSQELMNIGIYEFMDSVSRLRVYEASTALMKGAYSGFLDAKNIDDEQMDFMRDIYHS